MGNRKETFERVEKELLDSIGRVCKPRRGRPSKQAPAIPTVGDYFLRLERCTRSLEQAFLLGEYAVSFGLNSFVLRAVQIIYANHHLLTLEGEWLRFVALARVVPHTCYGKAYLCAAEQLLQLATSSNKKERQAEYEKAVAVRNEAGKAEIEAQ